MLVDCVMPGVFSAAAPAAAVNADQPFFELITQSALTCSCRARFTEPWTPLPSTATNETSASPIISAAAVEAVRAGFRTALPEASLPAEPPNALAGKPTSFASELTSAGAKPATPSRPTRVPPASASRPLPDPRLPPSVAYAMRPMAIANRTTPAIGPRRRRRASTAPSRTAAIGGTLVARTAGQSPASKVTITPSSSATTNVLVA
jgi:hypothetical protein